MSTPSTRLLIADDQRDVLEALRLLLKAEGYQIDAVESPAAVLKALEQRDYDVVLIDLNYARDTTSGQEGLELLTKIHGADEMLPVVVMTAWGIGERRGRSDAPRRARLRRKALGQRAAQGDRPHAGRARSRAAARHATRGAVPDDAERRRTAVDRGLSGDAAGAADHRARRSVGRQRAHHRRERDGQGRRRTGAARRVIARPTVRW